MTLARPLMTNMKMTIRADCAVSACSPFLLSIKHSCLQNPMDGGARQATVHGVAKSRTRLNDFTYTSVYKPLAASLEESAFEQTSAPHPRPQLPASEIKQTFLSANSACLLAFEQRAARPQVLLQ